MQILMSGKRYSGIKILYLRLINLLNHRIAAQHSSAFPRIVHLAFDHIGIQIAVYGRYEYDLLDLLRRFLGTTTRDQAQEAAIDVGANIGNHSLYFASLYSEVYAFEPNPLAYEMLKINSKFFAQNGNVFPIKKAVGAGVGVVRFISQEKNIGGSRIAGCLNDAAPADEVIKVESTSLDEFDFPNRRKVGILKLDVEGYELEVLRGASQILKEHKPLVLFEHAPARAKDGAEVLSFLQEHGYRFAVPQLNLHGARELSKVLGAVISLLFGNRLSLAETTAENIKSCPMVFAIPDTWDRGIA